jgi:VWFA-related protein
MKATIGQTDITPGDFAKLFVVFLLSGVLLSNIGALGQPILKETGRQKDFGKSLRKYEEKDEKAEKTKRDSTDEEPIRIATDLVVSDVLVTDQKGNAITGLKPENFSVSENGRPQEIGLFSFGESARLPHSIVLVIDYSSSQLPFIDNSIDAAKILVDKLDPPDRMAIVTDDVELLVDFTTDKTLLKNKLEKLRKKTLDDSLGKSAQFSALLAVLNEMFDEEDIRPVVIFQTDGDERFLLKGSKILAEREKIAAVRLCQMDSALCERKFGFDDILEKIEKSRATVYSIIPGIRFLGLSETEQLARAEEVLTIRLRETIKNEARLLKEVKKSSEVLPIIRKGVLAQQESLASVAELSGGGTDFIEKPEDAERVYSTIFQTIENRYVIGYYPKDETKDGKRRFVKIAVKEHPEYIITGRKSYFAPLENK